MNTTPGASMKAAIIGAETAGWSGRRTGKGRLNGGLLSAELGRCGRDFISDAASTHPIVAGLSPRPVALGLSRHWRGLRLRALGSPEWHMCRGRGVYTGSEQEPVPGPGRISRAMDRPAGGRGRDWMAIAVLSVVATDFYRPKTVVVQLSKIRNDTFLTHKAVALQRYFFAASDFCKRLGSYPDPVRRLEFNPALQGSRLQLFHGGS
jgi:hypothetical protein